MTRAPIKVYPFLMAVVPVVHMVSANPGHASLDDLAVVLATVLIGCAVVYGLAALAARERWSGRLPPLVVAGGVLWFWGYVQIVDRLGGRANVLVHLILLPLGIGATLWLGWWLLRRPVRADRLATFLTLASAMLVGWSALSIGMAEFRDRRLVRESAVVRRLERPIPVRARVDLGPRRDIYLIVLDEYANAEITRARYGFDNRVFLDSLRRLGFVVPAVHSNYLHTLLSIPSMLNASQLADIPRDLGERTADPTLPDYLVENNRVVPFLKSQGYGFAFFPSLWWSATRHNKHADMEAGVGGFDLVKELGRTELRRDLRAASMLDLLHRENRWQVADADQLTRTLAGVARVPKMPGAVFAFAHVLSPHKPFTFDGSCRPIGRRPAGGSNPGERYVGQIECLDHLVLDLVTGLLRESDVPPVILLQGDHGTSDLAFDSAATAEDIPVTSAYERLGAFGAYYLPAGGAAEFGDSVTIVNVLGGVLRYYVGADLPREPEDMYLSAYPTPYAFKRVDAAWLARAESLDRERHSTGTSISGPSPIVRRASRPPAISHP
jgi:hypothetical protein